MLTIPGFLSIILASVQMGIRICIGSFGGSQLFGLRVGVEEVGNQGAYRGVS